MTVTTRWWLIRHAPVINHGGRIYGHTDVDADTGNRKAFKALAAVLPSRPVYVVTPLKRTTQTLAALVAAQGESSGMVSPVIEPDLMEQNFGVWQGLTHAEVHEKRGAEAHRFWLSPARERPEDGESFTEVVDRVAAEAALRFAVHNLSLTRLTHFAPGDGSPPAWGVELVNAVL